MDRTKLFPILEILIDQWVDAPAMSQRITDLKFVLTEVLAMAGYSDVTFSLLDGHEEGNGTRIECRDDQDFGRRTSFSFTDQG